VERQETIPPYSLTAVDGNVDSISGRLEAPYSSERWWKALMRARRAQDRLAELIEQHRRKLIIVALPASYLDMVGDDLAALPNALRQRLRIVGPRNLEDVREDLQSQWLPYDARFDSQSLRSGFAGTTSDFPQRALRHFVTHVVESSPTASVDEHRHRVEESLARLKPYVRPRRPRNSDETLLKIIGDLWPQFEGNRSAILRHLRRHLELACEQSRFRRLANEYENAHKTSV
jgi:hypothetical protein